MPLGLATTATLLQTLSRPVSFVADGDVAGMLQAITVTATTEADPAITAAGDIVAVETYCESLPTAVPGRLNYFGSKLA